MKKDTQVEAPRGSDWRTLLRPETLAQLQANHREQLPLKATCGERDFTPCATLFTPWGAATFLLSECDEDGLAFGLSDLGFGCPELGYVSLDELASVRGPGGITIEEDLHWTARKTLNQYAREARTEGCIKA